MTTHLDETNKPTVPFDDSEIPPNSAFKPQHPPPPYSPPLSKALISQLSMLLLISSGYFGCIFMQGFFLPLAFICPEKFKYFVETSMFLWFRLTEILLARFMRIRVRHFGDKLDTKISLDLPNFILMTNHRTRLDWFYFWIMGQHLHSMKICLKKELAQLPGVGWAMQFGNFLFLKRRLELDCLRIRQLINYLKIDDKVQIFIFPEGTDLSPEAMRRCAIYSKKTNRKMPSYTLNPRTSGILHLVNNALPKNLDYIYDVTVAYPKNFAVNELDMLTGKCPEEVHLNWKRYSLKELPLEVDPTTQQLFAGEKMRDWVEAIWQQKEVQLREYYAKPVESRLLSTEEHRLYNTCFVDDNFEGPLSTSSRLILAYWLIYNPVIVYLIYSNYYVMSYFILFHLLILCICYRRQYGISDFICEIAGHPLHNNKDEGKTQKGL